jgi:hypothetical protein
VPAEKPLKNRIVDEQKEALKDAGEFFVEVHRRGKTKKKCHRHQDVRFGVPNKGEEVAVKAVIETGNKTHGAGYVDSSMIQFYEK